MDNSEISLTDSNKIKTFVSSKVPRDTRFYIPNITTEPVTNYINKLDSSKATGLDGFGPKIIKPAVSCLSPSIAALINRSLSTGQFPSQLKQAKVFPILKEVLSQTPQITGQFLYCLQLQIFRKTCKLTLNGISK